MTTEEQSLSDIGADKRPANLLRRDRVRQVWGLIAILAVCVWFAVDRQFGFVYILAGIAAWTVLAIHTIATAILGELYELNDQLAGRKDDFKKLVKRD